MSEQVDVLAYLQDKGVYIKGRHGDEVNVPCFYHGEDSNKRGRLYINISNDDSLAGLHKCHKCDARGNLVTLMRHFGDELHSKDDTTNPARINDVFEDACAYYQSNLDLDHYKWLKEERGLTTDTIRRHRLGWADGGLYDHLKGKGHSIKDMLASGLIKLGEKSKFSEPLKEDEFVLESTGSPRDFLFNEIAIPYIVSGNVVQIRGKQIGGKYRTPPGQKARLFNSDSTWGADELIMCEGEFDALVAEQMGYRAVGLPGASSWQDSWMGYLDQARRVYIIFDNDKVGQDAAEKMRERLGETTARIVQMPENGLPPGENDISEQFGKQGGTKDEFDSLIRKVRSGMLVSVFEAFEEWNQVQNEDGFKLGIEQLDHLLRPGIFPGSVMVPLAKTNTGKTLAMLNLFQSAAMANPDPKFLFCSLEQTRGEYFERARRIYSFNNPHIPLSEIDQATLSFWSQYIMLTDRNRMTKDDLILAIEDYEYEMGTVPQFVAIDYLGYFARSSAGASPYERMTNAIMDLKEVAKEKRIIICAPGQFSRGVEFGVEPDLDKARESGAIEETADFAFGLWNEDTRKGVEPSDRKGVLNWRILKSRQGGKGHKVEMQFGYCTLAMLPVIDPFSRFLREELEYSAQGETWDQAMMRHKTGITTGRAPEAD